MSDPTRITPEMVEEWKRMCASPREPDIESDAIPLENLAEYMASLPPPGPFVPKPYFDESWNAIRWYWKNEADYHEAVMIDDEKMKTGKRWVGDICRGLESEEPIGVEVFIDSEMRTEIANHYPSDFEKEARTALPLLIADWERQREEIEKLKQECCRRSDKVRRMRKEARDYKKWKDFNTFMELRETIEKLTPPEVPGHTLTVSIEAMAPGAVHSVCGKGKTVAEAVASLREMVAKKEA